MVVLRRQTWRSPQYFGQTSPSPPGVCPYETFQPHRPGLAVRNDGIEIRLILTLGVFDCKSFFISHSFVINLPTGAEVSEVIMDRLIPNCKLSKCGDRRAAKGQGHPPGELAGTGDEDVFRAILLGCAGKKPSRRAPGAARPPNRTWVLRPGA